jgi:hypothetical protein
MKHGGRGETRARVRATARWTTSLVVGGLLALVTTRSAGADEPAPSAEQLFQEARALVEKGDYAAACPKLDASQKLDPAVGTQFNLADCYEHLGRTATAFALFEDVAKIARSAGKFERERSAKERASALAPKLARIHVDVKATAPGLELRIDDQPLTPGAVAKPFPIDPGPHRIAASAPSHASWGATFAAQPSALVEVSVPELTDTSVRPAPPTAVDVAPSSTQKTLAIVAGGVGLAGVAVGTVSGIIAVSKRSSAQGECPSDVFAFRCPTESGTAAWNSATTAGNVSTISFVAGGVFLAGAAVLWFTAPSAKTRVGMAPSGLRVEGRF